MGKASVHLVPLLTGIAGKCNLNDHHRPAGSAKPGAERVDCDFRRQLLQIISLYAHDIAQQPPDISMHVCYKHSLCLQ